MAVVELPLAKPRERSDAARNRARVLATARRLIGERGADAVSMDDIAAVAGVGKGTLFRRFGNRAGLMIALLDADERAQQQAFMFGPAPLGPDAPAVARLVAFGRARLRFVCDHLTLLSQTSRAASTGGSGPAALHRSHVRMLLDAAGATGDLDVQADALLALLDAGYVEHQLIRGRSLESLADGWESLAGKLCGR